MKLRLQFGLIEPKRDINWWKRPEDFPHLVMYKNKKWQFAMILDDPTHKVDHVCVFEEVQKWDAAWHATTYEEVDHLFDTGFGGRCECGAVYTSFPDIHMFYCPKWSKW